MKKVLTLALVALMGLSANAQDLPQPSPSANVMQRVGLTDVEITYSRPAMRGRTIFGDLVPYGEMWRTGANKATAINFSTDVEIEGQKLEAGTYSLFTIPNKDSWTIILNKNTELWGVDGYSQDMDAARFEVEAEKGAKIESMRISVENVSNNSADVVIAWAETKASFTIKVNTDEMAMANIEAALAADDATWRTYLNAGNYYLRNDMDAAQALEYCKTATEMNEENWYAQFVYAQALAANGMNDEAEEAAAEAKEMGQNAAEEAGETFNYGPMIDQFVEGIE
ncbi:DUF2911 domain-containing protein [Phaeocystidibacter luteus]|uniref:DUF2911 domain-containing protein n=1 Tax=Phaeocystidibacter luteus TaxID=911197 RepID=A0A6N6RFR7_9FLAO|nr:DUF2911 domain-containing protein [Phaeocystidibacter luteus]KAB2809919.1 DUF2911 domain-containing protein [Phaeocystidibacter luteus]